MGKLFIIAQLIALSVCVASCQIGSGQLPRSLSGSYFSLDDWNSAACATLSDSDMERLRWTESGEEVLLTPSFLGEEVLRACSIEVSSGAGLRPNEDVAAAIARLPPPAKVCLFSVDPETDIRQLEAAKPSVPVDPLCRCEDTSCVEVMIRPLPPDKVLLSGIELVYYVPGASSLPRAVLNGQPWYVSPMETPDIIKLALVANEGDQLNVLRLVCLVDYLAWAYPSNAGRPADTISACWR